MPHGHSHGSCGQECDHDDASDADRGHLFSLFQKIDTDRLECLNEMDEGSGKTIFKSWDQRLDTQKYVQSDCDEELLFKIPFLGNVKLKGVILIGGEDGYHPSVMKLYKNRPNMSFDDVGSEADQQFDLQPDHSGVLEYRTKVAKFNQVQHLSIYLPSNFGEETTKVYYIGLRGDFTQSPKHQITIATYEARANPADHKTKAFNFAAHSIH